MNLLTFEQLANHYTNGNLISLAIGVLCQGALSNLFSTLAVQWHHQKRHQERANQNAGTTTEKVPAQLRNKDHLDVRDHVESDEIHEIH